MWQQNLHERKNLSACIFVFNFVWYLHTHLIVWNLVLRPSPAFYQFWNMYMYSA